MNNNYDLPLESSQGNAVYLLDANAGFYQAQGKGRAFVFVERYMIRKGVFDVLPEGTESVIRPGTYLSRTTDYQDLGGGMVSFERHYARVPDTWFDYQVVNYRIDSLLGVVTVNSRDPSPNDSARQVLAKVTRTYHLQGTIDGLTINFEPPAQTPPFTDQIIRPDELKFWQANIYELTRYTASVASFD